MMYWNKTKFSTIFLIFLSAAHWLKIILLQTAHSHPTLCPFTEALPPWFEELCCALWWGGWIWLESLPPPPRAHCHWPALTPRKMWGHQGHRRQPLPGWWLLRHLCNHEKNSSVKAGHCHMNRGEFLNRLAQQQIPIMQPGLAVVTITPRKQNLLFYALSLDKILNIYGWLLHFIPPFCQKVVVLVSSSQQLQTCESTFSDDNNLMRWFNMTDQGHFMWLIKDWFAPTLDYFYWEF